MRRPGLLPCLAALWAALASSPASATEPIVAVATVQAKNTDLPTKALSLLTELLHTRLASSTTLRVIPRPEVQRQLNRLRQQQLAACTGGSCPMELGRQLAANKVLVAQVMGAGEVCAVTLALFDVRTATEEHASAATGACAVSAAAASLSRATDVLLGKLVPSTTAASSSQPTSRPARRVSVFIGSKPTFAPVHIDGTRRGHTPLRLDLVAGRRYRLQVGGNFPLQTVERSFVARDWQRLQIELHQEQIPPLERATTSEWFSFALGGGLFLRQERGVFAFDFRLATLRWRYLYWTVVDFMGGVGSSGEGEDQKLHSLLTVGSRAGLPLHLGHERKHQLMLGLGLSYAHHDAADDSGNSLALIPGLDYAYLASNGALQLGGGVHAIVPALGSWGGDRRPVQLLFVLRLGVSLSPMIRAHRRKQRGSRGAAGNL